MESIVIIDNCQNGAYSGTLMGQELRHSFKLRSNDVHGVRELADTGRIIAATSGRPDNSSTDADAAIPNNTH